MGGYQPGNDSELDQAVVLVPRIYKAMMQSPQSPRSAEAFRELAEILQKGWRVPRSQSLATFFTPLPLV
jgi:flagellar biosynthesis/type III secretory pathway ATPase